VHGEIPSSADVVANDASIAAERAWTINYRRGLQVNDA